MKLRRKKKEKETIEGKVEEAESLGEKAEEVISSVWELLMHSRDHREALVLVLD